ncbi:MAG: hypothetical protein FI687_04015 [SAR202 cluster bacterium]|nr:hypothetical protein [SAR202 cluster bacterium]|tara:strand:- start:47645 stop:47989 length:345 start_codon:yes stop_codon:yes gene_type:complete
MTSTFIEDLNSTSLNSIQNGDIGIPKFIRYIAIVNQSQKLKKYEKIIQDFTRSSFLKNETQNIKVNDKSTYITKLLKWDSGQGAIITISIDKINLSERFDVLIIGSNGSIYHST